MTAANAGNWFGRVINFVKNDVKPPEDELLAQCKADIQDMIDEIKKVKQVFNQYADCTVNHAETGVSLSNVISEFYDDANHLGRNDNLKMFKAVQNKIADCAVKVFEAQANGHSGLSSELDEWCDLVEKLKESISKVEKIQEAAFDMSKQLQSKKDELKAMEVKLSKQRSKGISKTNNYAEDAITDLKMNILKFSKVQKTLYNDFEKEKTRIGNSLQKMKHDKYVMFDGIYVKMLESQREFYKFVNEECKKFDEGILHYWSQIRNGRRKEKEKDRDKDKDKDKRDQALHSDEEDEDDREAKEEKVSASRKPIGASQSTSALMRDKAIALQHHVPLTESDRRKSSELGVRDIRNGKRRSSKTMKDASKSIGKLKAQKQEEHRVEPMLRKQETDLLFGGFGGTAAELENGAMGDGDPHFHGGVHPVVGGESGSSNNAPMGAPNTHDRNASFSMNGIFEMSSGTHDAGKQKSTDMSALFGFGETHPQPGQNQSGLEFLSMMEQGFDTNDHDRPNVENERKSPTPSPFEWKPDSTPPPQNLETDTPNTGRKKNVQPRLFLSKAEIKKRDEIVKKQIDLREIKEAAERKEALAQADALDKVEKKLNEWEFDNPNTRKRRNIRNLLSSIQQVLWEEAAKKWKPVTLGQLLQEAQCRRVKMRAYLIVHPDRSKNRGDSHERHAICRRVFTALDDAWTTEFSN